MKTDYPIIKKWNFRNLMEYFSHPAISALCQLNPLSSAIATYFSGLYQQETYETFTNFLYELNQKIEQIEKDNIDTDFINSSDGKRIIGKVFRSIIRDNRIEKIKAMANLTANLYRKSKLKVDERDVYVDILDSLNVLQLSILQRAVQEIKSRTVNPHKGFGWEQLRKEYEQAGVTGALLLQSIRVLESNGLVNQNNAPAQEENQTHFVTFFGEQFYEYISSVIDKNKLVNLKV